MLALEWASDYGESCNWNNIVLELDAKKVVDEVKKKEDPSRWGTYHSVFIIKKIFLKADWSLN